MFPQTERWSIWAPRSGMTVCGYPVCLDPWIAQYLNVSFALLMILCFLASTILNPTVIILKIKEGTQAGYMFSVLAGIDLSINTLRTLQIAQRLLSTYRQPITSPATIWQTVDSCVYFTLFYNHLLTMFLLSGLRFLKITRTFVEIRNRYIILIAIIFNLVFIPVTVVKVAFASNNRQFVSITQIVDSEVEGANQLWHRMVLIILQILIILISLVLSVLCLRKLVRRRGPGVIPEASRTRARKACRALIVMNLLNVLQVFLMILVGSMMVWRLEISLVSFVL